MRRNCAVPELLHRMTVAAQDVWHGEVCIIKNLTSAVRGEKCSASGWSHLQYEERAVQCEEKM